MIIRTAIAMRNKTQAEQLTNKLVAFAIRGHGDQKNIDLDIAYYRGDLKELLSTFTCIDMAFIAYDLLEENRCLLTEFWRKNPQCISVPIGMPEANICSFLSLRPAGHLSSTDSQECIDILCTQCLDELTNNTGVLQISTRQGSYAVSASDILFCQSDQKYVVITTASGEVYRKIGKLDHLLQTLPEYFFRVHQSFLVNSHRLIGLDKTNWEVLLDSGHRIPVSRVYHKATLEQTQKCRSTGQI